MSVSRANKPKQPETHSREYFGLTVLKNSHKEVRRIKQQVGNATIHGNKFWKSSCLMMDYLKANPPKKGSRILEIGCGWGISGIYCAKFYDARVTGLDADETVFPYMQLHASINNVEVDNVKLRYEKVTKAILGDFDMVIASDICFWDEMTKPLTNLIHRCYQAGVERVVMTDPGRQPFREMALVCSERYDAIYDNWSVPAPYNTSGLVLDIG